MKEILFYRSYEGEEPHIFLGFSKKDRQAAIKIINSLIDRCFRVCYNEQNPAVVTDLEQLAGRITASQLAVFLISGASVESLAFRNCINYALSKNKKVFCIYLDKEKPGSDKKKKRDKKQDHGLGMQLANIPGARLSNYKDEYELCQNIIQVECFVQDLRGDDAKTALPSNRKHKVAIMILAAVLVVFLAAGSVIAVGRIQYENSLPGRLEKISYTDYLDLSNEAPSVIGLLEGKTVKTLNLRNMGLTDIGPLGEVNCENLDLSENPKVNTLEPLLEIRDLKTVTVTQDMLPAISRVSGRHSFKIVIDG